MTVIAWDGITLAADKMMSFNSSHATVTKIFKIGDTLVGFAGNASNGTECIDWVRGGRVPNEFPKSQAEANSGSLMVIEKGGRVCQYFSGPFPSVVEDTFMAIGSGDEFALAAMYLGKSAKRAVEVASALCPTCGNGIDTLEF